MSNVTTTTHTLPNGATIVLTTDDTDVCRAWFLSIGEPIGERGRVSAAALTRWIGQGMPCPAQYLPESVRAVVFTTERVASKSGKSARTVKRQHAVTIGALREVRHAAGKGGRGRTPLPFYLDACTFGATERPVRIVTHDGAILRVTTDTDTGEHVITWESKRDAHGVNQGDGSWLPKGHAVAALTKAGHVYVSPMVAAALSAPESDDDGKVSLTHPNR